MHTGLLRKKSRHSAGFFSYLLLVPTPRRAKHDAPRPHTGPRANKVCVGGFWGGGHWCVLVTGGGKLWAGWLETAGLGTYSHFSSRGSETTVAIQ